MIRPLTPETRDPVKPPNRVTSEPFSPNTPRLLSPLRSDQYWWVFFTVLAQIRTPVKVRLCSSAVFVSQFSAHLWVFPQIRSLQCCLKKTRLSRNASYLLWTRKMYFWHHLHERPSVLTHYCNANSVKFINTKTSFNDLFWWITIHNKNMFNVYLLSTFINNQHWPKCCTI